MINKKTTIIYMENLVQFQETALTKLSVCSGINTQPPNLVKCINEVWLNFQHQWIWIKKNQINWKNGFWKSHNNSIFEHIILCKIQESKQMFTSISPLSSSIYLIIWEKLSCIAVWLHVHFANFQMCSTVLIYIMALYFRSLWFPNQSSYFSKH